MGLRIIATGGTFDKQYDPIRGTLTFVDSHLPEILQTARLADPPILEINRLVDSLDMNDDDRLSILDSCRRCPEDRIVVIHGTDTMTETARVIGEAELQKTIVLTGAMVPYAVARSDALFNLGGAITAGTLLSRGVWVVMNGRPIPWNRAMKDREAGRFRDSELDSENDGRNSAP